MSSGTPSRHFTCEVCGQTTSRLFGVAALIRADDGRSQIRTVVLGYCGKHRADVIPRWEQTLAADGLVEWMADEPTALRPRDAERFLQGARMSLAESMGGYQTLEPGGGAPESCPHCGGSLGWGRGPHAGDPAVVAGRALAWECQSCGAAGLLAPAG